MAIMMSDPDFMFFAVRTPTLSGARPPRVRWRVMFGSGCGTSSGRLFSDKGESLSLVKIASHGSRPSL